MGTSAIDLSAGLETAEQSPSPQGIDLSAGIDLSSGIESDQPAAAANPNVDMSKVAGATPGTPSPAQVGAGGLKQASANRYVEPLNATQALTHEVAGAPRTRQEAGDEANVLGHYMGADSDHPLQSYARNLDPILASAPVGAYETGAGLKDVAVAAAHGDKNAAARGGTRAISGAMEAGTIPMGTGIAQAPIRMGIGYLEAIAAGNSAEYAAKKMGMSPDEQEFANTVATFLPMAYHTVKANTRVINERDLSQHVPGAPEGTTAKGVQMGPAGAMVTETPAGQKVLRTKLGPFTKNVTLSEGNQLPPAPLDPAAQVAREQAQTAASAMADADATDAAAKNIVNGVQPPQPGEAGSGKPPLPAGMERGQITPQTVQNVGQAIAMAPPEARGAMIAEAHQQLAQWMAQQGQVQGPDGQITMVKNPEQAQQIAAKWINDEVGRQQKAQEDTQKAQEKETADAQKAQAKAQKEAQKQSDKQQKEREKAGEPTIEQRAKTLLDSYPERDAVAVLQRNLGLGYSQAKDLADRVRQNAPIEAAPKVGGEGHEVIEEARATVDKQVEALKAGTIKAVHIPEGSKYVPQIPDGMKAVDIKTGPGSGRFIYDPQQIRAATIKEAAKAGTHGDLLGHIQTKQEIAQTENPVIVQARDQDGTVIQDSAVDGGNPGAVQAQTESLKERHPDAHISVVQPHEALNERIETANNEGPDLTAGLEDVPQEQPSVTENQSRPAVKVEPAPAKPAAEASGSGPATPEVAGGEKRAIEGGKVTSVTPKEGAGDKSTQPKKETPEGVPSYEQLLAEREATPRKLIAPTARSDEDFLRTNRIPVPSTVKETRALMDRLARERHADVVKQYQALPDKITGYRAVSVTNGMEGLDRDNLGRYWSDKESGARSYHERRGGTHTAILRAEIDKGDLDVTHTFLARMRFATGNDESELNLRDGAKPASLQYKLEGDSEWKPLSESSPAPAKGAEQPAIKAGDRVTYKTNKGEDREAKVVRITGSDAFIRDGDSTVRKPLADLNAVDHPEEKPADPNIGRTWNSEYGKQKIVSFSTLGDGTGKMYQAESEGTKEIRNYRASTIEDTIKRDEHRLTPEYAEEGRKAQEEGEQLKQRAAEQQAKDEKEAAEVAEYTKGKTPMESGRIKEALSKQVRYRGAHGVEKIYTRKSLIEEKVENGAKLATVAGQRVLEAPDGAFLTEKSLSKTGLDYARYLIDRETPHSLSTQGVEATMEASRKQGDQRPEPEQRKNAENDVAANREQMRQGLSGVGEASARAIAEANPHVQMLVDELYPPQPASKQGDANEQPTQNSGTPGEGTEAVAEGSGAVPEDTGTESEGGRRGLPEPLHGASPGERPEGSVEPVGAERTAVGPYPLSNFEQFRKRVAAGDITADDVRSDFEHLLGSEESVKAELAKLKVADLQKLSGSIRARDMKKAELIESVVDTMLQWHMPGKTLSYSMGMSFNGKRDFRTPKIDAMRKAVGEQTDEDLKKYVSERKSALDAKIKAITSPETYDQFHTFIRVKGEQALTPEQRVKWDEVRALHNRENEARDTERKATVSGVDTGEVSMSYKEGKHTKTGETLHIVQLAGRVPGETFQALNKRAKMLGGHYSSFIKADAGFSFKTKDAADKFMQVAAGQNVSRIDQITARKEEVKDNAVERLRSVADGMEEKANESLSVERKDNTDRRARMAASAEANAQGDIAMAKTLRNLAQAIEDGDATHLDGLRARTQVEALDTALRRAKYESDRKNNVPYSQSKDRPPNRADIDHATYPYPYMQASELLQHVTTLANQAGGKLLANRLRKYATGPGDGLVRFDTPDRIDDFRSAISKTPDKWRIQTLKDRIADYDRLQAAGIKDIPSLRAALREYIEYKGAKAQADGIRQMKRALVGRKFDGFFPTPKPIAAEMVEAADIKPGMSVLEPSAGWGNIADAVREQQPAAQLDTLEMQPELRRILEAAGHRVVGSNFLEHEGTYDRIVMNPPFEDGADMNHVRRAYDMLQPGGKLVAIMSEGPFFRSDRKATEFRTWMESVGGESRKLEDGAFKSSERPTGVATRIVEIQAPQPVAVASVPEPEPKDLAAATTVAPVQVTEKGDITIGEALKTNPKSEDIARILRRYQEKGKPAVIEGADSLITPDGRYSLKSDDNFRLEVSKQHDFSKEGWERALTHSDILRDGKWTSFNKAARDLVEATAKAKAEKEATEKAELEKEEHRAELQTRFNVEMRDRLKATKFKRGAVTPTSKNGTMPTIKGDELGGLLVHKSTSDSGTWDISHIRSGLIAGQNFRNLENARIGVMRMQSLADWTQDVDQLKAIPGLFDKAKELVNTMKNGATAMTPDEIKAMEVAPAPKGVAVEPAKPVPAATVKAEAKAVAPGTEGPSVHEARIAEVEQLKKKLEKVETALSEVWDEGLRKNGQHIKGIDRAKETPLVKEKKVIQGKIDAIQLAINKHNQDVAAVARREAIPLTEPEEKLVTDPDQNKWKYQAEYFIKALEPVKQAWLDKYQVVKGRPDLLDWKDIVKNSENWKRPESRPAQFPNEFIRIEVPGDGKFLVVNTTAAIDKLLRSAPSAFAKPSSTIPGSSRVAVPRAPKDGEKLVQYHKAQIDELEQDLKRAGDKDREYLQEQLKAARENLENAKQVASDNRARPDASVGFLGTQYADQILKEAGQAGKKFWDADVAPNVVKLGGGARMAGVQIANFLYPRLGANADAQDILSRARGKLESHLFTLEHLDGGLEKFFDKMSRDAQLAFIDRYKLGVGQPDNRLQQIEQIMRAIDDRSLKAAQQFKPNLAAKENHFRVIWKVIPGGKTAGGKSAQFTGAKRPWQGDKGFMKRATLDTISEGINAGGEPVTTNPWKLFTLAQASIMKFVAAQQAWDNAKGLGLRKYVQRGEQAPDGWVKINDRIADTYFKAASGEGMIEAGHWYAEPGFGRLLNNYLSEDKLRNSALGSALLFAKNLSTAVELSLSPFHAIFETLEAIGSQFGLGAQRVWNNGIRLGEGAELTKGLGEIASSIAAPYLLSRTGGNVLRYAENPSQFFQTPRGKAFARQHPDAVGAMQELFNGGLTWGVQRDFRFDPQKSMVEAAKEGNYVGALLRAVPWVNSTLMKPLFEAYIPRLKWGLALGLYSEQLVENAEALANGDMTRTEIARKVADTVENRFGEMNFNNIYWNNTVKSTLQLAFRSVTWKLGNWRGAGSAMGPEMLNSFRDPLAAMKRDWQQGGGYERRKYLPRIGMNQGWLLGMMFTTAVLGTVAAKFWNHKWPWEMVAEDREEGYSFPGALALEMIHPRTGRVNDHTGKPERISLPTGLRDFEHAFRDLPGYGKSSMSSFAVHAWQTLENRDAFKNYVYDPNGSAYQKLAEIFAYNVPKPISFENLKDKYGPQDATSKALKVAGLGNTSTSLDYSPAEQRMRSQHTHDPLTPEQVKERDQEHMHPTPKELRKQLKARNLPYVERLFKGLSYAQAREVYNSPDTTEHERQLLHKMMREKRQRYLKQSR